MENNFTLLVTAIFTAGSLGFINTFILEKIGVLIFHKSNEQDKKHFLFFFSFINYIIYLSVYLLIVKSKCFSLDNLVIICISLILTLLITITLSLLVFPTAANIFSKLLNNRRKHNKLSEVEHRSPRDRVFDDSDIKSVFIFNFDNLLIDSGFLESYSNDSNYYEITLVPFDSKPYLDDYDKVKNFFEDENFEDKNKEDKIILLDFEKKIKYYVIKSPYEGTK